MNTEKILYYKEINLSHMISKINVVKLMNILDIQYIYYDKQKSILKIWGTQNMNILLSKL